MNEDHGTARILLVDDFEPWIQHVCSILNQQRGFEIVADASDGHVALFLAEEKQPDLILLDVGLPSLNGIEVAHLMQKVAPACKILFVSENSDTDVIEAAFRAGALGYVVKSDGSRDLLSAIRAVLQGHPFISSTIKQGLQLKRIPEFAH